MVTSINRWEQRLKSYHKALERLAEIVHLSEKRSLSDIEKDGMIQRFEYTHELAWKLMKAYEEYQGYENMAGSRDATRQAFALGLITDGENWMEMIKSRNETSHNYDGDVADDVLNAILSVYFPLMRDFYERMADLSSGTPKDLFSKEGE